MAMAGPNKETEGATDRRAWRTGAKGERIIDMDLWLQLRSARRDEDVVYERRLLRRAGINRENNDLNSGKPVPQKRKTIDHPVPPSIPLSLPDQSLSEESPRVARFYRRYGKLTTSNQMPTELTLEDPLVVEESPEAEETIQPSPPPVLTGDPVPKHNDSLKKYRPLSAKDLEPNRQQILGNIVPADAPSKEKPARKNSKGRIWFMGEYVDPLD